MQFPWTSRAPRCEVLVPYSRNLFRTISSNRSERINGPENYSSTRQSFNMESGTRIDSYWLSSPSSIIAHNYAYIERVCDITTTATALSPWIIAVPPSLITSSGVGLEDEESPPQPTTIYSEHRGSHPYPTYVNYQFTCNHPMRFFMWALIIPLWIATAIICFLYAFLGWV